MKLNKRKMFLLISALVVLNTLTYSAPEDDAENSLNQIDKSIEQEKQRIEQEKQRKEFENTKFNSTVPEEVAPVQDNGIKFLINTINIEDKDKLLSSGEKKKLIKKYKGTELSANDITALLTQGTNKLIAKGYITSVASLSNNNDLRTGVLNLVIVAGKIEDVKINEGKLNDKIKEYVLFSKNSGKVLNVRDLDNVTDSLYSRNANKFDMKIEAGTKNSYSNILLHNELKDRFVISFNGNNYNQSSTNDKQNNQAGIYKESIGIKLDSPLGLNDTLGVRFTTMLDERNPNRDWKVSPDEIPVGTVLPIGPVGYKAGDYLGYKRKLEMFDFSYEVPFRTYRLKFNSSKSLSDSSIYAYNTVYDIRSDNTTIKLDLEKILWRNQTSKLIFDVGYKYKHNIQLFETATLTNRKLAILNTDLTYTTAFLKGLLGTTLTYERGLRGLGAERDDNKSLAVPEAQFDKYSINVNYYKPVSKKVTFRTNISGMYSPDVLYGSERTTSGGIGSVGGYQRGQTIQGDRSIEVSSELSYKIPVFKKWGNLEPYISYGYATTKYNYDDSEYAIGHISGTTIGARYNSKFLDLDIAYAKPDNYSKYLEPKDHEVYMSGTFKITF